MLESTWLKEANKDVLRGGERMGQIVGVVITFLVAAFLVSHWTNDTGFYTHQFNSWDALLLFGPLLFGIVPPVFRALFGSRNVVRPFEVLGAVLFVISAIYFLYNFHFDMQYFADPLPTWLRSIVDWMDEGWARLFLVIGTIGGTIGAFWTSITYLKVRELLSS